MKRMNVYSIVLTLLVLISIGIQPTWASDNRIWQRPTQLGVSGGNIKDSSGLYCCSGTLGTLVQDDIGNQYILSNNHVLARTNKGTIGDDIIQPGLIDQIPACSKDYNDVVADLSNFAPLSFRGGTTNSVDAAIALVRAGMVDSSGSVLHIGEVSNGTVMPALNMTVKKSGRTTGLTSGYVSAVNVTVNVTYGKMCGIGSQTARFTGQIMISPGGFSAGGDSGSLIVEGCSPYPRAVGLLFAGSSTVTVANPINDVLSSFGASMVGRTEYCTSGVAAAGGMQGSFPTASKSQLPPQANPRAIEAASKVKERNEEAILSIEGVVGLGVGLSEAAADEVAIEVYTKKPSHEMRHLLPEALENIPVKIVETGEIIAY